MNWLNWCEQQRTRPVAHAASMDTAQWAAHHRARIRLCRQRVRLIEGLWLVEDAPLPAVSEPCS